MKFINRILQKTFVFSLPTLMLMALFQSCAELEPDLTQFSVIPRPYERVQDLEEGLAGVYNQLFNATRFNDFYASGWTGDDITTHTASNKGPFRQFDQRNVDNTNARLNSNWRLCLDIINNANIVLDRSSGLQNLVDEQEKIERLTGEVYFIRGIIFHHLARIHGRIILPLNAEPQPDMALASQLEVYEQIESDLLEAETRLPNINPDSVSGATRPNKGSARAILARLYLDWSGFPENDTSKYLDAAMSAKQVIDNSAQHGFALLSDTEDLWKLENRFNSEGVYTISFCNECGLGNFKYGILGLPGNEIGGWQETFSEIKFFEDFPEGPRKEATYRNDLDWKNFTDQKSPVFKKITGPIDDLGQVFLTSRSDFWMRYAEVLLIYAEASSKSGNITPQAWESLNMIRRRAEGLPVDVANPSVDITSGDLSELAITERKWEFAGEHLRWYDLIRLERMSQALGDRQPQSSFDTDGNLINEHNPIIGSLGTDNYFSPIPQTAIEDNPNIEN